MTSNLTYFSYNKYCVLPISSLMLGLSFNSEVPASANPPPIICVSTSDGKCVMQGEGAIGGDGGAGGDGSGATNNLLAQQADRGPNAIITDTTPIDTAVSTATALKVQVNYVYRSQQDSSKPQPLTNDSVLQSGDKYKIVFTPEQTTWIYIFQMDSSGKMFLLFPQQEMFGVNVNQSNPVQANETRTVPMANAWFQLDKQVGTETIYFMASPQQDQELEATYQQYAQAQESGANTEHLAQAQLNQNIASRGLAAVVMDETPTTPHVVTTETGQSFTLNEGYLTERCTKVNGCVDRLQFKHQ